MFTLDSQIEMARKPTMSMDDTQKLQQFFVATLLFALFFWCWALKNTIEKDFDLGVVSFATVVVSSGYMLCIIMGNGWNSTTPSKLCKTLTICSHVFVAVNYFLGTCIAFGVLSRFGFGFYCLIFTFLWLGSAYFCNKLMNSVDANAAFGETLPVSIPPVS
ncbi:expressed unknown protein [Seminavis robusta]|uniref:Transmembrane protein n=1 Tax=Seminavis robusta TaxID=568900 RepID=A0A9N8DAJ0_9STRA|nr:expressed unknown protein [Seminavis robusta]|eukprot:Sro12_g009150.1 n/a (161) ;mRNA; f:27546-28282